MIRRLLFLFCLLWSPLWAAVPVVETYTENAVDGAISSITLTKPTGVAVNDLLVILVVDDTNTGTPQWDDSTNKPSGFTLIETGGLSGSQCQFAAFYRVATGSEDATVAVPNNANGDHFGVVGWYIRVSGADTSTPIHGEGTEVDDSSGTTLAITGLVTTSDDTLVFYVQSFDGGDGNPFSVAGTGWAEVDEACTDTCLAAEAGGSWGTRDLASQGASGTATVTSTVDDGMVGFQFAVEPAAASVPLLSRRRK